MSLTAAFIVQLAVPDLTRLPDTADEISVACNEHGLDVIDVKPWAHPSAGIDYGFDDAHFSFGGQGGIPPSPNLGM